VAERTILVCDICGQPAAQTVTFKVGRRNLQRDYCSTHLQELTAGARAPRRGRRPGVVASPATRRGRLPKAGAKRGGRPKKATATARSSRPRKTPTINASEQAAAPSES
jgi:hypothetical protein